MRQQNYFDDDDDDDDDDVDDITPQSHMKRAIHFKKKNLRICLHTV